MKDLSAAERQQLAVAVLHIVESLLALGGRAAEEGLRLDAVAQVLCGLSFYQLSAEFEIVKDKEDDDQSFVDWSQTEYAEFCQLTELKD